jgi:hypothetical protein
MKAKAKAKESIIGKPEKIIRKYGYEYHLVESDDRDSYKLPNACAFGYVGWALKSVNKIKEG